MRGWLAPIAVVATIVGLLGACGASDDISTQLEAAETLVVEFDLSDPVAPHEVTSKSVRYVVASGLKDGDQKAVIEDVQRVLVAGGWSVVLVEDIDVGESPATVGTRVVATRGDLSAQVAMFDQIGSNPAPQGKRWVQLQVARSGDPLEWAGSDET